MAKANNYLVMCTPLPRCRRRRRRYGHAPYGLDVVIWFGMQGPLHFSKDLTAADVKAHAFDLVLSNSLSGLKAGASVGGADFNVHDKSEAEIQR